MGISRAADLPHIFPEGSKRLNIRNFMAAVGASVEWYYSNVPGQDGSM